MYLSLLFKSFKRKKARYVLPTIALIIGIAVGSSLIMVRMDIKEKIELENKELGPNLIAVPESDDIKLSIGGVDMGSLSQTRYMSEANAEAITSLPLSIYDGRVCQVPTINAYLFSVVKVDNATDVILGGTWFDQVLAINGWWRLNGEYPSSDDEVVIGRTVAEKLDLDLVQNNVIKLHHTEIISNGTGDTVVYRSSTFKISGILTAGGEDDNRIFGKLASVQNLTNLPGKVTMLHISTLCATCDVDAVGEIIEQEVPEVEVQTIKQVTHAQERTLTLVQSLVGFITGIAIVTSLLAVMTTMSLAVMERRKEIGLMKTIGAYNSNIAAMFLGEGLIMGAVGGGVGLVVGIGLAQILGDYAFESSILVPWWIFIPSFLASFAIVFIASVLPIRKALSVDPVVVLRGD